MGQNGGGGVLYRGESHVDFALVHLKWCQQDRPALKDHPVVSALLAAYVERLKRYVALPFFTRCFRPIGFALTAELKELNGWVMRQGHHNKFTDEEENQLGDMFVTIGCSYSRAKEVVRRASASCGAGRPTSRRAVAIAGLELKLREDSLTWREVTARVCDCPKRQHNESCEDNLRAGQKDLNRLLRKYGCAIRRGEIAWEEH